jgi:hypothetical protein
MPPPMSAELHLERARTSMRVPLRLRFPTRSASSLGLALIMALIACGDAETVADDGGDESALDPALGPDLCCHSIRDRSICGCDAEREWVCFAEPGGCMCGFGPAPKDVTIPSCDLSYDTEADYFVCCAHETQHYCACGYDVCQADVGKMRPVGSCNDPAAIGQPAAPEICSPWQKRVRPCPVEDR